MEAFLDFVQKEIFFASVMFLMTLSAACLLVWRIMLNFNCRTDLNLFLPRLQEVMAKEGIDGALKFCKAQPETELIPRKLCTAGLENAKLGLAAMKRGMATVLELEVLPDLNFLLAPILAIAKIATMVGLLGTVISMIGTFTVLGKAQGGAATGAASAEIGLALFATALGLLTAIPLVFAHVLFKAWIHKFEVKCKSTAQKLLLLVQALKAGQLLPPAPPQAQQQPQQQRMQGVGARA